MRGAEVARGPAARGKAAASLFDALLDRYGLRGGDGVHDLGGSSNLNLLLPDGQHRYVVRVYRPWVTAARLAALQLVHQRLAHGGVPCLERYPRALGSRGFGSMIASSKLSPTSNTTQKWIRGSASQLAFRCLGASTRCSDRSR